MGDLPPHRYTAGERRPVEVLVYRVAPDDVDEFLRIDHEVWTLGEADVPGIDGVPFLSKEVWLDDGRPGEITIVIEWPSIDAWDAVDDPDLQARLTAEFDRRFKRPYEAVETAHTTRQRAIHRWSRFEPDHD